MVFTPHSWCQLEFCGVNTEALDSDHARYITSRITQHARSMTAGTRSLPTDSPVPYFQPLERGTFVRGST